MRTFTPTKDTSSERRKAVIKNYNLPLLQYMYHGNSETELHCLISGTLGFINVWSPVSKRKEQRFRIDFDHIRQKQIQGFTGTSIDKSGMSPSAIFRGFELDKRRTIKGIPIQPYLIEMMTCMPVCTEYHSYKTQDSKYGDIVLTDIPKKHWPWVLKNKTNYNKFCKKYGPIHLTYEEFIGILSDINKPPVVEIWREKEQKRLQFLFENA